MANTFKQVIPTANRKKTKKTYSFDHITSQGFMTPMPIAIRECVPNQDVKLALESFTRLNPLVKPTFGRARVNNRAFWVPFRVIMPRFSEFLESEPIYSLMDNQYGLQTTVPRVTNTDLLTTLTHNANPGSSSSFDFIVSSGGTLSYYTHTAFTHFALKLFNSLGYKLDWELTNKVEYSALPLLAWAKIMIDWYFPNQYINSSVVQSVQRFLVCDSLTSVNISSSVIDDIVFLSGFASYNDSLLVDCWDRPVAPNQGVESAYSIPDVTLPNDALTVAGTAITAAKVQNNTSNSTPIPSIDYSGANNTNRVTSITQYQHDVLKALTDYTTRHRLAGVRAVDRYLAEYGINLSSEIMKRSLLIGNDSFNIQFGDVMAHSDTFDGLNNTGAVLGDYAGKGIGYGNHVFNYQIGQEFGYLIVVNTVIPDVQYYQGVSPLVKHLGVLDFWHADFDGLGVAAVASDEVYMPETYDAALNLSTSALHQGVFGFAPRYYEYKTSPSFVTGDFIGFGNYDLKAYYLGRDLAPMYANNPPSTIRHNLNFVVGGDANQYNRIFYNSGKAFADNFNMIHHFEVVQVDETAPLYDTYDFKEVERAVEVHTNAAKVN